MATSLHPNKQPTSGAGLKHQFLKQDNFATTILVSATSPQLPHITFIGFFLITDRAHILSGLVGGIPFALNMIYFSAPPEGTGAIAISLGLRLFIFVFLLIINTSYQIFRKRTK